MLRRGSAGRAVPPQLCPCVPVAGTHRDDRGRRSGAERQDTTRPATIASATFAASISAGSLLSAVTAAAGGPGVTGVCESAFMAGIREGLNVLAGFQAALSVAVPFGPCDGRSRGATDREGTRWSGDAPTRSGGCGIGRGSCASVVLASMGCLPAIHGIACQSGRPASTWRHWSATSSGRRSDTGLPPLAAEGWLLWMSGRLLSADDPPAGCLPERRSRCLRLMELAVGVGVGDHRRRPGRG